MVNDAAATITEIDTGALANSDTLIPTSKAVTTAIAGVGSGGFGGLYVNLSIKNNSTNPNYQMDVSATTILLENSSKAILRIDALSETVDITASGVNGLDTGSEAGSTWYHIWAIAKADGTKDCLLSASATAPMLPAGYTYKAYLGAVYNNASSNFGSFIQTNNKVVIPEVYALAGGSELAWTSVSLSTIIPSTAKAFSGYLIAHSTPSSIPGSYLSSTVAGFGVIMVSFNATLNSIFISPLGSVMVIEAQTTYYNNYLAGNSVDILISMFEY